jgi:hypothetical protein
LRRDRAIVGEAMPLTDSLDAHANATERMADACDRTRLACRQPGTERRHDCLPIESKRSAQRRNGARRGHGESTDAPRAKCYSSFLRALRRPQSSSALNPCGAINQTKRRQKGRDAKLHGNCDSPTCETALIARTAPLVLR